MQKVDSLSFKSLFFAFQINLEANVKQVTTFLRFLRKSNQASRNSMLEPTKRRRLSKPRMDSTYLRQSNISLGEVLYRLLFSSISFSIGLDVVRRKTDPKDDSQEISVTLSLYFESEIPERKETSLFERIQMDFY